MTSPNLIDDIKRDEGCRLHAYPDPISGGKPWTIGYGCTGPTIGPLTVWTQEEAEDALVSRVLTITSDLMSALPWFHTLSPERQDVLVNMAYNLGVAGLLGFTHTLGAIKNGNYGLASGMMLQSRWASQVGQRAVRLSEQMRTGVHQP